MQASFHLLIGNLVSWTICISTICEDLTNRQQQLVWPVYAKCTLRVRLPLSGCCLAVILRSLFSLLTCFVHTSSSSLSLSAG